MPDAQRVDFLKRGNETSQGIADTHAGLPPDPTGAIMSFNKFIQVCGGVPRADTSAVAAINRALRMPGLFFKVRNCAPMTLMMPCVINPLNESKKLVVKKIMLALVFAFFLLLFPAQASAHVTNTPAVGLTLQVDVGFNSFYRIGYSP